MPSGFSLMSRTETREWIESMMPPLRTGLVSRGRVGDGDDLRSGRVGGRAGGTSQLAVGDPDR